MINPSESVPCRACGKNVVPAKQEVPEYGGIAGLKAEYRCPNCGAIISTKDVENR